MSNHAFTQPLTGGERSKSDKSNKKPLPVLDLPDGHMNSDYPTDEDVLAARAKEIADRREDEVAADLESLTI